MTNTTKLAEKAAKFLGWQLCPQNQWKIPDNISWLYYVAHKHRDELTRDFFEGDSSAPILAHLAKREMERRGFEWSGNFTNYHTGESLYEYQIYKDGEVLVEESEFMDENEYKALWLAIEKTGVLDD